MNDNPYERYDIDPREGPEAITRRMRELIEQADEDARAELREVWEQLTLHPRTRLHAALDAFPETRPKLGEPPSDEADWPEHDWSVLELADIVLLPSVLAALRGEDGGAGGKTQVGHSFAVLPPLDEDPILDDPK